MSNHSGDDTFLDTAASADFIVVFFCCPVDGIGVKFYQHRSLQNMVAVPSCSYFKNSEK